jgi:hypothetical protein
MYIWHRRVHAKLKRSLEHKYTVQWYGRVHAKLKKSLEHKYSYNGMDASMPYIFVFQLLF